MLPSSSLLVYAIALLYPTLTAAKCECGYKLKQTQTYFTHRLYTDFSTISDAKSPTDVSAKLVDWGVQEYTFKPSTDPNIMLRKNERENVWIRNGLLHLRQKGYAKGEKGPISVAEIQSRRSDFYYGSFRAKYRVKVDKAAQGGSVGGFFFYYDDNDETDIEVLTKDGDKTIHYTQHPAYDKLTDSSDPDATYKEKLVKPWTQSQEHRFDWLPGVTRFYQDNTPKKEMTKNVPKHDGWVILNLWANNGSWSGPPSTKDVHTEIEYILVYFNTTSSQNGTDEAFNAGCRDAGGLANKTTVCTVDDKEGKDSEDSKLTASATRPSYNSGVAAFLTGLFAAMLIWA